MSCASPLPLPTHHPRPRHPPRPSHPPPQAQPPLPPLPRPPHPLLRMALQVWADMPLSDLPWLRFEPHMGMPLAHRAPSPWRTFFPQDPPPPAGLAHEAEGPVCPLPSPLAAVACSCVLGHLAPSQHTRRTTWHASRRSS